MFGTTCQIDVPNDGTVTLPEAFRGTKVVVIKQSQDDGMMIDDDFYRFKPLKEILEEQGARTVVSLEELMPSEPAWDSEEEFFKFLEAIGEDVDNYR